MYYKHKNILDHTRLDFPLVLYEFQKEQKNWSHKLNMSFSRKREVGSIEEFTQQGIKSKFDWWEEKLVHAPNIDMIETHYTILFSWR